MMWLFNKYLLNCNYVLDTELEVGKQEAYSPVIIVGEIFNL